MRHLWFAFFILAAIGWGILAVRGFKGELPPWMAGTGCAFMALSCLVWGLERLAGGRDDHQGL